MFIFKMILSIGVFDPGRQRKNSTILGRRVSSYNVVKIDTHLSCTSKLLAFHSKLLCYNTFGFKYETSERPDKNFGDAVHLSQRGRESWDGSVFMGHVVTLPEAKITAVVEGIVVFHLTGPGSIPGRVSFLG